MKRSAHAAVRDPSRRAQRIQLLKHAVPTLEHTAFDAPSTGASSLSASVSEAALRRLVDERLEGLLPGLVARKVAELRAELAADARVVETTAPVAELVEETAPSSSAEPAPALTPNAAPKSVVQTPALATSSADPQMPASEPIARRSAPPAGDMPSATTGPKVRVVTRNPISGAAALADGSPSLARKASPQSTQPALAPRCFAHAGQHYLGASEDDVVAAWSAMRERFRLTPENKIVARRALLDWLQRTRTVCSSNIHWYGDFVAVRSCPVRVPEDHPGHGVDGWFLLFDPNGESFLRAPLFAEAFDAPDARHSGVVPQMARPAWIAEERRAAAAARSGGEQGRPFSPETADDLTANDFFRGLAE